MKLQIRLWSLGLALSLLLGAVPVLAQAASPTGEQQAVNINSAGIEQLTLLPRIGPAIAHRIVEFRQANGKFQAPEELLLVRGIGEKTYQLLSPYVIVDGETTLSEKVSPARGAASDEASTDQRER